MNRQPDYFTKEVAQGYDERNRALDPIMDCLHFLIGLILKDIPPNSRILCVGAGTGAEILALSKAFPEWSFVALDPSLAMLDICRERITAAGLADRCEFIHGYIEDISEESTFDGVLSILVAHFVAIDRRGDFFYQMVRRLRPKGYLINMEFSGDLDSVEFLSLLKPWESVQLLMGATPESLASFPKQLREVLTVIPPSETEAILHQSGIDLPVHFFQTLVLHGWYGKKA